ncbi:hypothetical protein HF329_18055 [Chitinophaga oryzae]|uniref:Uncharacterized protein n=1 Tax=Chitinophaga oryzae TaxID=2725414 RepID=A0AAE6ZI27_9BACT|nr:hypothetical protein [Chitinophaga oryzae]QJB33118.1 hypothetical protein HF329_18055 [Chitinophaga oryzae]
MTTPPSNLPVFIRTATGRSSDPYGITVSYRCAVPVSAENLEDSDPLE